MALCGATNWEIEEYEIVKSIFVFTLSKVKEWLIIFKIVANFCILTFFQGQHKMSVKFRYDFNKP